MKDITRVQNILSNQIQTRTLCFKTSLALRCGLKTKQERFQGSQELFVSWWNTEQYLGAGLKETPGAAGIWESEIRPFSAAGALHTKSFPHKWGQKPPWWAAATGRFSSAFWSKPHCPCSQLSTYTATFSKPSPFYGLYIPGAVRESRTSQLRWKRFLGCGTSIPRMQENFPIQLGSLSKVSKSKTKAFTLFVFCWQTHKTGP